MNDKQCEQNWIKATLESPMTHCDKCNLQVPLNDNIMDCPYCGAKIHEPTGPECQHCGTQMQDKERKCVVCGAEIQEKYNNKPVIKILSWFVYRNANGFFGLNILGWISITILVIMIMLIYGLINSVLFI